MEVSVWPKGYIFSSRSSVIRVTNCTLDGLLSNHNIPTILFLFSHLLKKFHEMFGLVWFDALLEIKRVVFEFNNLADNSRIVDSTLVVFQAYFGYRKRSVT